MNPGSHMTAGHGICDTYKIKVIPKIKKNPVSVTEPRQLNSHHFYQLALFIHYKIHFGQFQFPKPMNKGCPNKFNMPKMGDWADPGNDGGHGEG